MNIFDRNQRILSRLMKGAENFALDSIEADGNVFPFILIAGKNGGMRLEWDGKIADKSSVRAFVEDVKKHCAELEVYATAYVHEDFISKHTHDPFSRLPDCKPALVIHGETRDLHIEKEVPVRKDHKGLVIGGWAKTNHRADPLFSKGIKYNDIDETIKIRWPWMMEEGEEFSHRRAIGRAM